LSKQILVDVLSLSDGITRAERWEVEEEEDGKMRERLFLRSVVAVMLRLLVCRWRMGERLGRAY
jgi:hypothetical protein